MVKVKLLNHQIILLLLARTTPPVVPLGQSQSSRTPQSSNEVTPTRLRLPTINDPSFLNRNLYGINIEGEKQLNISYPGPRDILEELRRRQEEATQASERRMTKERRNPPRRKLYKRQ